MSANNTWNDEEKSEVLNDEDLEEILEIEISNEDEESEDEESEEIHHFKDLTIRDISEILDNGNGLHPNHAKQALNGFRTPLGWNCGFYHADA